MRIFVVSSSVQVLLLLLLESAVMTTAANGFTIGSSGGIASSGTSTTHRTSSATKKAASLMSGTIGGVGGSRGRLSSSTPATTTTTTKFPSRGGGALLNSPIQNETKCPASATMAIFGSVWGTGGVLYILYKAISRVWPIAYEPLKVGTTVTFTNFHWMAYIASCVGFAYVEGYKGFQCKFSPLVVKRSCTLVVGSDQGTVLNYILAPLYSMGLVHATKKRKITSWCVTIGVALIVGVVKRLSSPWRNIIDAGVVVGLSCGAMSIILMYLKSWYTGIPPNVDPCLPVSKVSK